MGIEIGGGVKIIDVILGTPWFGSFRSPIDERKHASLSTMRPKRHGVLLHQPELVRLVTILPS